MAELALTFSRLALRVQPVLVTGSAGWVSRFADGRPFAVLAFTVARVRIVEIDILADPTRLRRINLAILEECQAPA